MRWTCATAVVAAALALVPASARADGYPEQVYTAVSPAGRDWLALLTLEGRWAIQVGDGCPTLASGLGLNVMLSTPVEADGATLWVPDDALLAAGEACPIKAFIWQTDAPCVTHDGVCDVAYDRAEQ